MGTPFQDGNRRLDNTYVVQLCEREALSVKSSQAKPGYSGRVAELRFRPLRAIDSPGITHNPRLWPGFDFEDPTLLGGRDRIILFADSDGLALCGEWGGGTLELRFFPDDLIEARAITADGLFKCDLSGEADPAGGYWACDVATPYGSYSSTSITATLIGVELTEVLTEPEDHQFRVDYRNGRVQVSGAFWADPPARLLCSYYAADEPLRAGHFEDGEQATALSQTAAFAKKVAVLGSLGRLSKWLVREAYELAVETSATAADLVATVATTTPQIITNTITSAGAAITVVKQLTLQAALSGTSAAFSGGIEAARNVGNTAYLFAVNSAGEISAAKATLTGALDAASASITGTLSALELKSAVMDQRDASSTDPNHLQKSVFTGYVEAPEIRVNGGARIYSGGVDPRSSGQDAVKGSLYLSTGTGNIYFKSENSNDYAWNKVDWAP